MLFAFVGIYTIAMIGFTPFIVYGYWLELESENWCHIHIYDVPGTRIGVLFWIVMDTTISITLLFLFQQPLSKLLSMRFDPDLGYVVMKSAILCWLSIVSTLCGLLFFLWKHVATLIEVNMPFACLCIILMHVRYEGAFKKCCCCCIFCFRRFSKRRRKEMEDKKKKRGEKELPMEGNPKMSQHTSSSDSSTIGTSLNFESSAERIIPSRSGSFAEPNVSVTLNVVQLSNLRSSSLGVIEDEEMEETTPSYTGGAEDEVQEI